MTEFFYEDGQRFNAGPLPPFNGGVPSPISPLPMARGVTPESIAQAPQQTPSDQGWDDIPPEIQSVILAAEKFAQTRQEGALDEMKRSLADYWKSINAGPPMFKSLDTQQKDKQTLDPMLIDNLIAKVVSVFALPFTVKQRTNNSIIGWVILDSAGRVIMRLQLMTSEVEFFIPNQQSQKEWEEWDLFSVATNYVEIGSEFMAALYQPTVEAIVKDVVVPS